MAHRFIFDCRQPAHGDFLALLRCSSKRFTKRAPSRSKEPFVAKWAGTTSPWFCKDRLRGELNYEANRRAESEIQALSRKLDLLRDKMAGVEDLIPQTLKQSLEYLERAGLGHDHFVAEPASGNEEQ
jgi:hypothetical protein